MFEQEIFLKVLKQGGAGDRSALLEQACGGDVQLRERVAVLLRAHDGAGGFLESPAAGPTIDFEPVAEGPGTIIGPYKLLQQIGEGGMGIVYMADQETPVRRRVAVKIIKPGMDSRQVIARFEAERQALAMMDHQNIAKVLDAGTTESGRPYFVMELVHGVPLTKFCDDNRLTLRERLELFVPVCQAIQHAHQKGVIHRDIKPSNILVTMYDDKPVPKVIDFGVAKAVEQRLTEKTLFTQYGMLVGTFEYMSPEQAEMNAFGVDTRSDVYSLGVLLYELLTGTTPLERPRVREAAFVELVRLIKEEEPPRPSVRLSSASTLPKFAAACRTEAARLPQLVRGELDWIVMKCLEKDRTRRYETVNGLARDVQRYLKDEPVEACPPSLTYRFKKMARKHRTAIFTVVAFAALLVLGTAVSTWQAVRATVAERHARADRDTAQQARAEEAAQRRQAEAERERALTAERQAQRERAIAAAVNDFLRNDLLAQADPSEQADPRQSPDKDLKLRTVLDRAAKRIGGRFLDKPLVEAATREAIGNAYYGLGEYDLAQPHVEAALGIRRQQLGEDHPVTLASQTTLASMYAVQSQYAKAEPLLLQSLEVQRKNLGEDHADTLRSQHALGYLYWLQGKYAQAESLLLQTLEGRRKELGQDHPDTLTTQHGLAWVYWLQGQYAEAEPLYLQTWEARKKTLGQDHPHTLATQSNLAFLYESQGQYAKAESLVLQTWEARTRTLGQDHPDTLSSQNRLASMYSGHGQFDKAEPLHWQTVEVAKKKLGEDHSKTLIYMHGLAACYESQGQYAKAEPLYLQTLEVRKKKLGEEHPDTQWSRLGLARLYRAQGRFAEAESLLVQTLEVRKKKLGEDHPYTLLTQHNLALVYRSLGEYIKAEPLLRDELERQRRRLGALHPQVGTTLSALSLALLQQRKYAEAEPLLRECLQIRQSQPPNDWKTFHAQSLLGESLLGQQKYAEAEPLLLSGFQGLKHTADKIPAGEKIHLTEALQRLVQIYDATNNPDEAAKWRVALDERNAAKQPADDSTDKP